MIPASQILVWAHLQGCNVTGIWAEMPPPKRWRARKKGWDVGSVGFTEFMTNAPLVFQREAESEILAARVADLERHVGRLTLDLEASKKGSRLLTPAGHRNGRS